jgi:hypothetical protein
VRILLILLALAASASAEIIVYKGTARTALPDGVTSFGSLPHVYLVVDLAAKKGYYVLYYTVNGKKGSITLLPLDTHYVARFVSAARTAGTFSAAIDSSSGTDIGVNLFYLRGNTKPLALSSQPAAPTSNYPRTLAGFLRVVQSIQISSIYELNLTLAFDPVHTQIGNDGFQSGQQEVLTIASELAQKGF